MRLAWAGAGNGAGVMGGGWRVAGGRGRGCWQGSRAPGPLTPEWMGRYDSHVCSMILRWGAPSTNHPARWFSLATAKS